MLDGEFIADRTRDFELVERAIRMFWPERVERITGMPESKLRLAAKLLGRAKTAIILTARGPEQQSQGVNNVLAFINLALALGKAGKPLLRLWVPDWARQWPGRPGARAESGPVAGI